MAHVPFLACWPYLGPICAYLVSRGRLAIFPAKSTENDQICKKPYIKRKTCIRSAQMAKH